MKATAAVLTAPKTIEVREIELPPPGEGDVLIELKKATLCPTDIKKYNADKPDVASALRDIGPYVLGHEAAGVILEVGAGVTSVKPGELVAVQPMIACGHCHYCKQDKTNMCLNLLGIGASAGSFTDCVKYYNETGVGGCYATHLKAPQQCVIKLPKGLSLEAASLTEPLGDVIHSVDAAHTGPGDVVVIIGMGPMGLMHIPAARYNGATEIICVDIDDARLAVANKLGAKHTVNSAAEDPIARVKELTDDIGADKIFVTSGGRAQLLCAEQALKMAAKQGTVSLFASAALDADTLALSMNHIHYSMLNLTGTVGFGRQHGEKALEMLASGILDYTVIRNKELPLSQIEEAINLYGKGENLKVGLDLTTG
ncbi:alcohol dehydrogenase catalytic domain-containing protein [Clostridia bacterium OttesenSCG-928-O13]|nr:alcohol dehydrogenase catalytic domain-containing protein [Clostridia bacterium OttesenSCG-928-O13]